MRRERGGVQLYETGMIKTRFNELKPKAKRSVINRVDGKTNFALERKLSENSSTTDGFFQVAINCRPGLSYRELCTVSQTLYHQCVLSCRRFYFRDDWDVAASDPGRIVNDFARPSLFGRFDVCGAKTSARGNAIIA